jgi:hypothetical protein
MPLCGGECVFRKEALIDGETKILTATYLLNLTFKTQRITVFSAFPSHLKTFAIEFIFGLYFLVSPLPGRCFLLCHCAAARYFFLAAKVPKSALGFSIK